MYDLCPTGIIHIKDMLLFNINDNKIKKELLDIQSKYKCLQSLQKKEKKNRKTSARRNIKTQERKIKEKLRN